LTIIGSGLARIAHQHHRPGILLIVKKVITITLAMLVLGGAFLPAGEETTGAKALLGIDLPP
jgi:hypothetical protein